MNTFHRAAALVALSLSALVSQATTITMTDPNEGAGVGYPVSSYVNAKPGKKQLHVIGVYYGKDLAKIHVTGTTSQPVTLVLSSYEKTQWVIDGASRGKIGTVILNGLNASTVTGQSVFAKVINRTGFNATTGAANYWSACAYAWPDNNQGCDTASLVTGVQSYTGQPITSFTGVYQANDFTVKLRNN